ncbi:MAG: hypothetical protein ACQEP1_02505 [Nanobdellota archaeon]
MSYLSSLANKVQKKKDPKPEGKSTKEPEKKKSSKKGESDRADARAKATEKIIGIISEDFNNNRLLKSDINKIFRDVKDNLGLLPKKTGKKKSKKKAKASDELFDQEEIKKIFSKAHEMGDKQELISKLFFNFGVKLAEIAKLRLEDIDFDEKKIKLGDREVKVDEKTLKKIFALVGDRKSGKVISPDKDLEKNDILNMIQEIMGEASVKKRKNLESAVDNFLADLNKQGKPYMYWEHFDKVLELRNKDKAKVKK